MKTVVGVFKSRNQAEKAVRELKENGFGDNEISVVAKDGKEARRGGGERVGREAGVGFGGDDIGEGVTFGGGLGGLAGLLAGAGALAIPGIGPIIAAGPIAGALSGAVTGGVAGGLLDFGIPEERGRHFEERIRQGDILALVRSDDQKVSEASMIFRQNGAQDVETREARKRA